MVSTARRGKPQAASKDRAILTALNSSSTSIPAKRKTAPTRVDSSDEEDTPPSRTKRAREGSQWADEDIDKRSEKEPANTPKDRADGEASGDNDGSDSERPTQGRARGDTPEEADEDAAAKLERLKKDWTSTIYAFFDPIPKIEYHEKGQRCHTFVCTARSCVGKNRRGVRRCLETSDIQHENPIRAKALEAGYEYICRKVWTDEEATWTERREAVAILAQDALDYGFRKLGLDPSDFAPVTDKEQDLMRSRIYGSRKILKYAAREIVKGANGYGFVQCANNATPEVIESTGAQNLAIVATLLHKQGLVFLDPSDRTLRGSMFKHPAIQAMAEATVFKNVLADAIQHPEWFDDAPPPPDDDTAAHKPQFSAVFLNLLICALRGAISEWSSGHWVKESFSRKIYHSHFVSDLKMFRDWEKYTSNPTVLTGHGPTRTLPPSYLTRTLQESITENARFKVFKDIVAPVPSNEVLDTSDFALNQ
ncbi:hypothetical protein B0H14DRAFT_3480807 [Mycena olivaceomarginata]|nr:hypothetical protein B0H14DRAFT_3480807 [Mycena olivaceomarginata]